MLSGKVALVTGASRGIGRAVALELAQRGVDVVINHRRNSSRSLADALAQEISQTGRRALVVKADVGSPEEVSQLFQQTQQQFGHLDILVNNAASAVFRPLLQLEAKHWQHVLDVNLLGLLWCARAAAPLMQGRRGTIINMTSLGSRVYMPGYGALGAMKAAIESITRSLAVELAPAINVNAVCGGFVEDTGFSELMPEGVKTELAGRAPAGRLVRPEDMARVVAFLCSDDAEMIRGQALVVDGGLTLKV